MAVFNITTIADFTIVANTIDMLCTNYFKVTPFSGSPKKSVLSRRGLPSSSGSKRDLGDNNLSQQYLDDEGNFSPPPWSTAMFHHALFPYFSTCFIISTGASPVRPHCTTDHHGLVWVISTLPKWYYIDDGDNNFFWHVNHSSRLPCESSNWISSCVSTSQAMFSAINWHCALLFFSWGWRWRCLCNFTLMAVLTSSMIWIKKFLPESKSVSVNIFACVISSREF